MNLTLRGIQTVIAIESEGFTVHGCMFEVVRSLLVQRRFRVAFLRLIKVSFDGDETLHFIQSCVAD
jgi:hypothetical protein